MRLLYVCSDFGIDPNGTKGASIHLRSITRALCEVGHEVSILSPKGGVIPGHPATMLSSISGGPAETVGKLLKTWLIEHEFNDAAARELRPLLYNAWAPKPALAAIRENPPDAIIERLSLFGHVGLDLGSALKVPLFVEMNAPLAEEAATYRSLQLSDLARRIEHRVLSGADGIAVVSQPLAKRLAESGIDERRVHVLPNGADLSVFDRVGARSECRARWNLGDAFVVGFVGSLKPWHGVEVLLRAVEPLTRDDPRVRLLVVGDGPAASSLRELALRLGIGDRAVFTGALAHEDIPAALRAMDVAVAPFIDIPGFYFSPIKLFEYMAAGLCVVASRLGQLAEVIEDGTNGLLCESDHPRSLYESLRRAHQDAELRERLGVAALETVRSRYTWKHTADRLAQLIEGATPRRRGRLETVEIG